MPYVQVTSAQTVPGASPMMTVCFSMASTPAYWLKAEAKNSSVWRESLTGIDVPGKRMSDGTAYMPAIALASRASSAAA